MRRISNLTFFPAIFLQLVGNNLKSDRAMRVSNYQSKLYDTRLDLLFVWVKEVDGSE